MKRLNLLFVFALVMAITACGNIKNPLANGGQQDQYDEGKTEYVKDLGMTLSKDDGLKSTPIGMSGKSKFLPQTMMSEKISGFKKSAAVWPTGQVRNDVYGLIESFTNYSHQSARTNVVIPVTYPSVPVGIPESGCIIRNGQFRCDMTVTVSSNATFPLPVTSVCAFSGITTATGVGYYPFEMFSGPHDIFILMRDNNGAIFPQNHFVTSGPYAPNCGKTFYRITVNVRGFTGDLIGPTTGARFFSTSSWDRLQNDFPLYSPTVSNATNDGRLIQFYVTSDTPVLFKPEYRTANMLWTWRIGDAQLLTLERWTASTATTGAWVNVAACAGTQFTGAFDLNQAVGGVDEGYLARFNHTVAGCVTQTNTPFSVILQ